MGMDQTLIPTGWSTAMEVSLMDLPEFTRLYSVRARGLMWLLGAGASAASGVPTAYDLIWRFKQMLFCSEQHIPIQSCADLGDTRLQSRIQQYFDGKSNYPKPNSEEEYAHYFEAAFPDDADRSRYIEQEFASVNPSYGYYALAVLMKMGLVRLAWTTNFDSLIEDVCARVYGSTARLTVATLDTPGLGTRAIVEERFPLLVKLHGDFRSRRLKNIRSELREQDAELRRGLVETSKRFGLIVAGYSGRDRSIMDALEEAVESGCSFPYGLFWFYRSSSPCYGRVVNLIERARQKEMQAELIEVETFDELMADMKSLVSGIPADLEEHLNSHRNRVSDAPTPQGRPSYPIIRLNAIPVTSRPAMCRKVTCDIGGTKEVREAIHRAGADVLAVRRKSGVIAFGSDAEIRKAFAQCGSLEMDLHTFEATRLRYDSADLGLIYDALSWAFQRERPLILKSKRGTHLLTVNPQESNSPIFDALKKTIKGQIFGLVPSTTIGWAEAVRIRLEYRNDVMWLLLEPTIWTEEFDDEISRPKVQEFIRARLVRRYNPAWNELLNDWSSILTNGGSECTVRAFGIADGCDASFSISRTPGFSPKGEAS